MKKRGAEGSALSLCKGCSDPFPEQLQKEKVRGIENVKEIFSAAPPARSTARAVSYSQFVPGKTGMSAFGRACLTAGATRVFVSWEKLSTVPLSRVFVG